MRFELKSLQESFGITAVYVTHDQEEALALSDRIGLMHEGTLLEVGAAGGPLFAAGAQDHRRFSRHSQFCPGTGRRPWRYDIGGAGRVFADR